MVPASEILQLKNTSIDLSQNPKNTTYAIEQQIHKGRIKDLLDLLSLPVVAKGTTRVKCSSRDSLGSDILGFSYRGHASWSGSSIEALWKLQRLKCKTECGHDLCHWWRQKELGGKISIRKNKGQSLFLRAKLERSASRSRVSIHQCECEGLGWACMGMIGQPNYVVIREEMQTSLGCFNEQVKLIL